MTATLERTSALATRHGKAILALLCAVAFLDFVDASIVNVALPSIRTDLHVSVQGLQWIPSGYLLTYGGFMLLGGRAADLFGRRRVLVAGTILIGLSSLAGGLAANEGMLVAARLAQGVGAAMMLPAALSILTTTFTEPSDRHTALGVWGGVGGLASAAGVLLGGVLTDGPGWRWVMFVNPPAAALVLIGIFKLLADERPAQSRSGFDVVGSAFATAGMLLLVYGLVKAPEQGWGSARTVAELLGAGVLAIAFVIVESRTTNPVLPLSIFRIRGLAAADVTQLIAFAGFLAMFFFLTLYMQNVLGFSPLQTGAAYLPLCVGVGIAAGISAQLLTRVGTRPVIVAGCLIASGGHSNWGVRSAWRSSPPSPPRGRITC
jgi:EmrB/QacA subfamily drug resistance transporter